MSLIWRYLRRYRWYCLTALLFVLIEANCELLLPTLMARMIDEGGAWETDSFRPRISKEKRRAS